MKTAYRIGQIYRLKHRKVFISVFFLIFTIFGKIKRKYGNNFFATVVLGIHKIKICSNWIWIRNKSLNNPFPEYCEFIRFSRRLLNNCLYPELCNLFLAGSPVDAMIFLFLNYTPVGLNFNTVSTAYYEKKEWWRPLIRHSLPTPVWIHLQTYNYQPFLK